MTQQQEQRVDRILEAIAAPPNRRDRPVDGDLHGDFDFWFDGGACQFVTGNTHYVFDDGATACVPLVPPGSTAVDIQLHDGQMVRVVVRIGERGHVERLA